MCFPKWLCNCMIDEGEGLPQPVIPKASNLLGWEQSL